MGEDPRERKIKVLVLQIEASIRKAQQAFDNSIATAHQAFDKLCKAYSTDLLRYFLPKISRNRIDRDSVLQHLVQDVWVKIWIHHFMAGNRFDFEQSDAFRRYVFTVARNCFNEWVKQNQPFGRSENSISIQDIPDRALLDSEKNDSSALGMKDAFDGLESALATLKSSLFKLNSLAGSINGTMEIQNSPRTGPKGSHLRSWLVRLDFLAGKTLKYLEKQRKS